MDALLLGTPGLGKLDCASKFVDNELRKRGFSSRKEYGAEKVVEVYDIDGMIKDRKGGIEGYALGFLDTADSREQERVWNDVAQEIAAKLSPRVAQHRLLLTHGVYYRDKRYFSRVNWSFIAVKFRPSVVITLIDDAYDISERIEDVERLLPSRSSCSFSEALEWRTVEIMYADVLSRNLYLNPDELSLPGDQVAKLPKVLQDLVRRPPMHFVVAVKHPPETFHRLLFEKWRPRFYIAFPISSTRYDKEKIQEINLFRSKMHRDFLVFDPVTIDELPLLDKQDPTSSAAIEHLERDSEMHAADIADRFVLLKRWPLSGTPPFPMGFPKEVDKQEFVSLYEPIRENIVARDLRMVQQSDFLVAYRPYWGGRPEPSGGVNREMTFANDIGRPIYVFHKKPDDGDPKYWFTGMRTARIFHDETELLNALHSLQERARVKSEKDPMTWE